MTTRCDLTDLLTTDCAHCRGHSELDEEAHLLRSRLLASPGWLAAQYPGTCDRCGDWFQPGAAIRRDLGGWRAECCAEEEIHHG